MPEKRGRLAKILEQEYKTQGFVSGTASAAGKRIREIIDLRNLFFSGSGMGSIIGRKIFGKGYSATNESRKLSEGKLSPIAPTQSVMSDSILLGIKQDTKITAKNSIVLPQLARDMNLVRQNISKLVKLQGGTASQRADMFFKRSGEREAEYERRFGTKLSTVSTTPTQVNKPEGFGLQGTIAAILAAVGLMVAANWEKVKPYYEEFKIVLYKVLGTLAALSIAKGALSMPRPSPVPTPGAPGKPGSPTPGTPTPGAPPSGSPEKSGPTKPSQRRPGTKPGGLAIPQDSNNSKLIEKLKKLLQSPKAKSKFLLLMGKRGLGWIATALFFSGPVGWVVTAILGVMAYNDIMDLIDEAFKDDTPNTDASKTPTNMNQQQSDMANLIYTRFREAGFSDVQSKAAVANAMAESSLNPSEHNTKGEDSVGLFQMNRKGGLGQGHSVEDLKDPEYNIALAIDAAKKSKSFRESTNVNDAVSSFVKDVERPKDQSGAITKRTKIAMEMQNRNFGSAINSDSIAMANGLLGMNGNNNINNVTNNIVQNQQSAKTGSYSQTETFDVDLVKLLLSTQS